MIIPENFKLLRQRAINRLPASLAKDSFGYHIDVVNDWESMHDSSDLLHYLGIHNTHASRFSELCFHTSELDVSDKKQIKLHAKILHDVRDLINTSKPIPPTRYDFLELLTDWRVLRKYKKTPFRRVADFGGGCGRQSIGLFANAAGKFDYFCIDASLNGYSVQNILLSYAAKSIYDAEFVELLDYDSIGRSYEHEMNSSKSQIVHFPAWFDYEVIPPKSLDLVIAAHVHNEISGSDFDRLIQLVDSKLSEDGVFYVRSELGVWQSPEYFDSVFLHKKDIVSILREKGIYLIDTFYLGGFQTSVFSRHLPTATTGSFLNSVKSLFKGSSDPFSTHLEETRLPISEVCNFKDAAFYAAHRFMVEEIKRVLSAFPSAKLPILCEGFPEFDTFAHAVEKTYSNVELHTERGSFLRACAGDDTKVCVISSQKFYEVESSLNDGKIKFKTRIQYTYPVVFLHKINYEFEEGFEGRL